MHPLNFASVLCGSLAGWVVPRPRPPHLLRPLGSFSIPLPDIISDSLWPKPLWASLAQRSRLRCSSYLFMIGFPQKSTFRVWMQRITDTVIPDLLEPNHFKCPLYLCLIRRGVESPGALSCDQWTALDEGLSFDGTSAS